MKTEAMRRRGVGAFRRRVCPGQNTATERRGYSRKVSRIDTKTGAAGRRGVGAFTLIELMLGISMTAVVLVAALTGVVTLQRSYSASEQYATGMADQTRLLDYLALDLRRAMTPPVMDPDEQGIKIVVPNYYRFNASDPQHLFPVANDAMLNPTGDAALYADPAAPTVTTQTIAYRFLNGAITRDDPWQPLVSNGHGGFMSSGPVTIASSMDAFPSIAADPGDATGATFHYNVTFHSTFQPLATANPTNAITLHSVTFVRSQNFTR